MSRRVVASSYFFNDRLEFMQKLLKALQKLDQTNDNDWTTDGFPRVERVNEISGGDYSRKQITEAAPQFFRKKETETPKPWDAKNNEDNVEPEQPGDGPV